MVELVPNLLRQELARLAEDDARIDGSFRISAGRNTTKEEIKELIKNLIK